MCTSVQCHPVTAGSCTSLCDGIPPPCTQVPLAAEKVEPERAKIRAYVAAIRAAFDEHGDALHALLLQLAPPDCP